MPRPFDSSTHIRRRLLEFFVVACLAFCAGAVEAQSTRLVILKFDGVPFDTVDRFVHQKDSRTGKSQLPWIEHIFYERGTRLNNFYVRGISLSGPSWSLLETGQHAQIKGNVEFDRYTMHAYDYLNLIPFFVKGAAGKQVDMPGVEVLDSLGIPLLGDAYSHEERYSGFSIYQRGPRYLTFPNALQNRFKRPPRELFDEWTMGLETYSMINDELIRELIKELQNPKRQYLDIILQDFDHLAHHNSDMESQLRVLKELDDVIGRVWTTIQNTPQAEATALVVVSDHGMNTDPQLYSQGFNLVRLLGSTEGGGHHVATKRRLLLDYSIKGLNPFYYFIVTPSRDSYYLKGKGDDYPTALLDFDGNERAAIHVRDSDLNLLHIILQQLQRRDLEERLRKPLTKAFFETIQRRRAGWQNTYNEMNEELGAIHRSIEKQEILWQQQPKKLTEEEKRAGRDDEIKRVGVQLSKWKAQEREYSGYATTLANLLALRPEGFDATKLKLETVIPIHAVGDHNNVYGLQNYVAGISPHGLVLDSSGILDMQKSFVRLNYFSLLHDQTVRNNVQPLVSNRPIEMIATTLPSELFKSGLTDLNNIESEVVWVYGGDEKQALIFARVNSDGQLMMRYQPIKHLTQDISGHLSFEPISWQPGLPLGIIEDPALTVPSDKPAEWLSAWHTDVDWLHAVHRTLHSDGVIGLYETLAHHPVFRDTQPSSDDDRLMHRFVQRQRTLTEADLLLIASNHWNFDVRGFNPGGNHGAFFRISTHSTWLMAGGDQTHIPRGLAIDEPYDSLSFMPTMLALTGKLRDDRPLAPELSKKGFGHFPGRVVKEVIHR
ncbi:MAG TPA: alkaline phosphatase family protein [Pyrinomonadaceae bacterium]|nr:alkaline phosphatase family protein [Pyrinomonadaceae bacterium]